MSQPPAKQSDIANQLVDFAVKILKPGGVSVGGLYGLWALFIEAEVAKAIAATLIGFCFSYAGKLLEPIHQGNQRRLQGVGCRSCACPPAIHIGLVQTIRWVIHRKIRVIRWFIEGTHKRRPYTGYTSCPIRLIQ